MRYNERKACDDHASTDDSNKQHKRGTVARNETSIQLNKGIRNTLYKSLERVQERLYKVIHVYPGTWALGKNRGWLADKPTAQPEPPIFCLTARARPRTIENFILSHKQQLFTMGV